VVLEARLNMETIIDKPTKQVNLENYRGQLTDFARRVLDAIFSGQGYPSFESTELQNLEAALRVNVTVRVEGRLRGSMSGEGTNLSEQVADAVARSLCDDRYDGRLSRAEHERASIELWIEIGRDLIPVEDRESGKSFCLGVHGIDVEAGEREAYFKPSVPITSERFKTVMQLLRGVCKKAGLPEDAWRDEDCFVYRSSWLHFVDVAGQTYSLKALRSRGGQLPTAQTLRRWVFDGARYLSESQTAGGFITYMYDPLCNRATHEVNYVRQAGCAYALSLVACEVGADVKIAEAARKSIDALIHRCNRIDDRSLFIVDDKCGGGKVGTSALALLAMQNPIFSNQKYSTIRMSLRRGVMSRIKEDGNIECTFPPLHERLAMKDFAPGQVLLALLNGAEDGERLSERSLETIFQWSSSYFEQCPNTAFTGWQIEAWAKAYAITGDARFAKFAIRQACWLSQLQELDSPDSVEFGGYSKQMGAPNFSTIVYTEAIGRAALLAYESNDESYESLRHSFRAGLLFASKLRLQETQAFLFADAARATGGVALSVLNFRVRADVVQHFITLCRLACDAPELIG